MQVNDSRNAVVPIDKASVHKICSGQVIISLSVAVKELVENSIDAGSTVIDIRLKQYGSTLIEVVDNGCGVHDDDLGFLARKHHTSKLNNFLHLESVETFGFRGEALSSLCALCDVTVVTRHKTNDVGVKLEFDHDGKIKENIPNPRQIGTTVILKDIFKPLPVRHKEFTKNLKTEFNKMLQMLFAYCIISKNIRITCSNQLNTGKKILVTTHGNDNVMQNLRDVYGLKGVGKVLEFVQCEPDEEVLNEFGVKNTSRKIDARFEGYVSSNEQGFGRSQCDRQFYYINGRPCDSPKFAKIINETYHLFNKDHYPLVVLNLLYDRKEVDVNVTPDKRKLFLNEEKMLFAILKSSVLNLFKKNCGMYNTEEPAIRNHNVGETFDIGKAVTKTSLKKLFTNNMRSFEIENNIPSKKQKKMTTFFASDNDENSNYCKPTLSTTNIQPENNKFECIQFVSDVILEHNDHKSSSLKPAIEIFDGETEVETNQERRKRNSPIREIVIDIDEIISNKIKRSKLEEFDDEQVNLEYRNSRKKVTINFSIDLLKKKVKKMPMDICDDNDRLFTAKINPDDNSTAESELKKQINKSNFKQMEIIGQFNLGFIVAKLGSDLFIIDQHASDEKFNYETLEKSIELKAQPLIHPQLLFLTAVEESIIVDNINIFEKNGFTFDIDSENGQAGQRVKLVAVPYSENVVFDKSDVEELIYFLNDSPGVLFRPTRVQKMLAMRACRKSIMIGTALNRCEMNRLVGHMSELDQPWNCPHGRPTIRHLVSLNRLK